jgi:hypothetical protein
VIVRFELVPYSYTGESFNKKVCDGGLNPWTQEIVKEEFLAIPKSILNEPENYNGIVFNKPDPIPPVKYEFQIPSMWRNNFDYGFMGRR